MAQDFAQVKEVTVRGGAFGERVLAFQRSTNSGRDRDKGIGLANGVTLTIFSDLAVSRQVLARVRRVTQQWPTYCCRHKNTAILTSHASSAMFWAASARCFSIWYLRLHIPFGGGETNSRSDHSGLRRRLIFSALRLARSTTDSL
jgi:hypothetical protein